MYSAHRKIMEHGEIVDQELKEHLENTAKISGNFAETFGCGPWGYCAGQYHDLGKYSEAFQNRIKKDGPKVDHSTAGAKETNQTIISAIVAGHHSGLMDFTNGVDEPGDATLRARMKKKIPDYQAFRNEMNLERALEIPALKFIKEESMFQRSFLIRMLYSCLVDADFLDTEAFMSTEKKPRGLNESWQTLNDRLKKKTDGFLKRNPQQEIGKKRNEILGSCLKMGKISDKGLFTLTVPTGGGKTISSLAFAMEQVKKNRMKRIIYVIPFTSIIDQTVEEFQAILGKDNVLAHHSHVSYDDAKELTTQEITAKKLACENWDAPVVVTTNVQFFESLFGSQSSQCRKLHNIAESVIILDEAQMLPQEYLIPCVHAIAELIRNYRCSAVLCTATQPALRPFFAKDITIKEICQNTEALYNFFRRVRYQRIEGQTTDSLAAKLNESDQFLCIVNTKRQALELYQKITGTNKFYLSTWMMPSHRQKVIAEIKRCLENGEECKVVSTSLIEAGVDVDFPVVYRESAGLDSMIQAGGRCNREGKHPLDESFVYIFEWVDKKPLSGSFGSYIARTKMIARKYNPIDAPECIHAYFEELYSTGGETLDQQGIMDLLGGKNQDHAFQTASNKFKMINERTYDIFIANEVKAEKMLNQFRFVGPSKPLLRAMGQYSVSVREDEYKRLEEYSKMEPLDDQIAVLKNNEDYSLETGLLIPEVDYGVGYYM